MEADEGFRHLGRTEVDVLNACVGANLEMEKGREVIDVCLALEEMKRYWGEMILDGADTFWELYNPYNKHESPYGSSMVNSYCHAWSCTPTYLLRKFYKKNEKFRELFE